MLWDPPEDEAELEEALLQSQARWQAGTAYSWTIEALEDTAFLGRIGIRQEAEAGEWSIGYWIHPERQGAGFATEAAQAVVTFGFEHLGAALITAACATWNHASMRVLERIGMQAVRTNPKGFKKRGAWVEEIEFELRRA